MSQFTCITCRVSFSGAEIQRSHYKTDWHRYNLKRKVIELPPITAEEFQTRVCQQRAKQQEQSKDEAVFCKVCRKSFSTNKAFNNHVSSKKHKMALEELEATSETMLNDNDVIGTVKNLPKKETVDRRNQLPHLKEITMDIDEEDSDWEDESDDEDMDEENFDPEEFDEISENNPILFHNCLFCAHHSRSISKNLKHMFSEHTFFIPDVEYVVDLKGLLLYLGEKVCRFNMCLWCNLKGKGFYSMDAAQAHMKDKGHCKMLHEGESLVEYMPYYDYSKSYPDDEEGLDDEVPPVEDLDTGDYQLTLPSGAKIGHRSLLVYYKQHFNPRREIVLKKQGNMSKIVSSYMALGKQVDKISLSKKARDIKYISRLQSKYYQKLGVKANKFQKHFRPQVNF